jgi:hypothetical protein
VTPALSTPSALGGTVLTSQAITLAGHAFPSLAAYRTLFAICAAAALAGAVIALVIPMASAPAAALQRDVIPLWPVSHWDISGTCHDRSQFWALFARFWP